MNDETYVHLGGLRSVGAFKEHLERRHIDIPLADQDSAADSTVLATPLRRGEIVIGNRFAIHPMEGWDGTLDGRPTDLTERRWRHFGRSGAKVIWGGEAGTVL